MVLFGLGEDGKCLKYKFGKLFEGFPFHFIFVNISYNKLFPNEPFAGEQQYSASHSQILQY